MHSLREPCPQQHPPFFIETWMSKNPPLFNRRRYLLAFFIVLLAVLDPFGLASSSDKASAQ